MRINFNEAEKQEQEYLPIPDGEQLLEIKKSLLKKTKSGEDMLSVEVKKYGSNKHEIIFLNFKITKSVYFRIQSLLKALNLPHTGEIDLDPKKIVGVFKAVVAHKVTEQYGNQPTITKFLYPSEAAKKAVAAVAETPVPQEDDFLPLEDELK